MAPLTFLAEFRPLATGTLYVSKRYEPFYSTINTFLLYINIYSTIISRYFPLDGSAILHEGFVGAA